MKNLIILFTAILLFASSDLYSQVSIQIGGGLGYISPVGDYGGSTVDFYNGTKYGMSSGFNYHAKARVGLLGLNLFGIIEYSTISGEGEGDPTKTNTQVENSHSIFSIKAGPEFNISPPLSPVGFYLDGFVSVNTFSGTVKFQGLQNVNSSGDDIQTTTRFGVGAGGGVLWDILPIVTLDFGVHFNLYNLFGKEYATGNDGPGRIEVYTSLNDEKDPLYETGDINHIVANARAINAWQFTLTAMIGI